jgi:transposase
MDKTRDELKVELSELGPRGRGRPYPKGLLEKLLSYTVARRRQGAKLVEVAAELGMPNHTLSRWVGEKRAAKHFERVEVIAEPAAPAAPTARALIVHGPRGLRIEGLDITAIAELVRRVGE